MHVQVTEMWVTSSTLVLKVEVWGSSGEWRQKRYASLDLREVPEEVLVSLTQWHMDQAPEEDHHQTALF